MSASPPASSAIPPPHPPTHARASPPAGGASPASSHPSSAAVSPHTSVTSLSSVLPPIDIPSRRTPILGTSPNFSSSLPHSTSAADRLASLYPAPTPPLPETPHAHRSSNAVGPLSPTGAFSPSAPMEELSLQSFPKSVPSPSLGPQPSPLSAAVLPRPGRVHWRRKLVLVLVGLPARGKSYIAYKLMGYLRWRGLNASLFNVGKHRRQVAEAAHAPQSAEYFSAENKAATNQRDEIAMEVLDVMLDWLQGGGDVSIFDATNTTSARRQAVLKRCQSRSPDLRVIFLESICDDARVLEVNYRVKAMNSPDYAKMPLEDALRDLRMRVENYEKVYESIADDELSYIKLHNLASKVICNKIHGALGHAIAAYLMSIHIQPRPIYFVRAGHSESERGEREIVGQQFQDRQILKLPDADPSVIAAQLTAAQREQPSVPTAAVLSPSAATQAAAAAADFHIPYSVATAANLDSAGKAFAKRLDEFITYKVYEYTQAQEEAAAASKTHATAHTSPQPNSADGADGQTTTDEQKQQHQQQQQQQQEQQQQEQQQQQQQQSQSQQQQQHDPAHAFSTTHSIPGSFPVNPAPSSLLSAAGDQLPLVVYTSTLPRAIQSAQLLKDRAYIFESQSSLNMMDTGVCSGMSIDEIRNSMPEELSKWQKHKFRYRFPGGESQADRAKSLEPLVFELERQTLPVLVVSHMSTLQVLLGFFYGSKRSVDSYYSLWIPQHVVLELIPHQYGWLEIRHDLSEEACREAELEAARAAAGEEAAAAAPVSASTANSGAAVPANNNVLPAPARAKHVHRSPRRNTMISVGTAPRALGAVEDGEVERFNLQVVANSGSKAKARAQAKAAEMAGTRSASGDAPSGVHPPRNLAFQDRSISVPPHNPHTDASPGARTPGAAGAASPSLTPVSILSPSAAGMGPRKISVGKSIGKSSAATVLGETNFYSEDAQ